MPWDIFRRSPKPPNPQQGPSQAKLFEMSQALRYHNIPVDCSAKLGLPIGSWVIHDEAMYRRACQTLREPPYSSSSSLDDGQCKAIWEEAFNHYISLLRQKERVLQRLQLESQSLFNLSDGTRLIMAYDTLIEAMLKPGTFDAYYRWKNADGGIKVYPAPSLQVHPKVMLPKTLGKHAVSPDGISRLILSFNPPLNLSALIDRCPLNDRLVVDDYAIRDVIMKHKDFLHGGKRTHHLTRELTDHERYAKIANTWDVAFSMYTTTLRERYGGFARKNGAKLFLRAIKFITGEDDIKPISVPSNIVELSGDLTQIRNRLYYQIPGQNPEGEMPVASRQNVHLISAQLLLMRLLNALLHAKNIRDYINFKKSLLGEISTRESHLRRQLVIPQRLPIHPVFQIDQMQILCPRCQQPLPIGGETTECTNPDCHFIFRGRFPGARCCMQCGEYGQDLNDIVCSKCSKCRQCGILVSTGMVHGRIECPDTSRQDALARDAPPELPII